MADVDARRAAHDLLLRVEGGAFLDALVGPAVERLRDRRDAALLTRLAYGVETWRLRLDWSLQGWAKEPLASFEPAVRTALRLGLFQLLFLDRIPAHAAVDTSVELAKRTSPGGARVVNAILRRAGRDGERPLPPPADDVPQHLSVRWSHPPWLVELWLSELGRERTEALLEANDLPGPSSYRVDLRRTSRDDALAFLQDRGVDATKSPWAATAVCVEGPVGSVPEVDWLAPQGVASQIVARMVGARAGERILDLCAAPGGKAAAIAESEPTARVLAADRARGATARAARLRPGRPGLDVLRADGTRPPFRAGRFDAVLVDAPCSGLGTLRSHPELRWRRNPEDVARLADLQRRLVEAAAELVRPGGRLVYATCTIVRAENEDVVSDFTSRHREWTIDDPRLELGAAGRFVGDDHALRTSPERDGLDGFFAVALRNTGRPV